MAIHKRYNLASNLASNEALGQLGGSDDLELDIALCSLQTIEPLFRKHLPATGRILEAGAGRGRWVFYLRRLGYDVEGIEIASSEVEFAKQFDLSVPIHKGDVLNTQFPDGHFSAVISLGVLEHFEDGPQAALKEVVRLLSPQGLFLVTVPTENLLRVMLINRMKDAQTALRRMQKRQLAFEEYRYSRRRFEGILRESGFRILEKAADDFLPPKNMGLYTDSRLLRSRNRWELNPAGNILNAVLRSLSPWLCCSGTLWVCRRP